LAQRGYAVWCDLTKLLGGEAFWDDIQAAIEAANGEVSLRSWAVDNDLVSAAS
jgi:hypothetical protein